MKRIFLSDCEGPISRNDNAFELTHAFVPAGDKIFSLVSKYDDVLAEVLKKPGYNPGDTLKLVLPFLKAYDVTDKQMREFSAENLLLIADTKESLKYIRSKAEAFIVSTSYQHYIEALCKAIEFPFENTFCTQLNLDKYRLTDRERTKLREIAKEIAQSQMITIPDSAVSMSDLTERDRETVKRFDRFFWHDIMSMDIGKTLGDVTPVGGRQKADAVKTAAKRAHVELRDVIYVGDSITDVEAFRLVRAGGGLTLSFNGNQYAVRNAQIAIISESNLVTAYIASLFCIFSKQEVLEAVANWNREPVKPGYAPEAIVRKLHEMQKGAFLKVNLVTAENEKEVVRESGDFRKKVRGQAIGGLG